MHQALVICAHETQKQSRYCAQSDHKSVQTFLWSHIKQHFLCLSNVKAHFHEHSYLSIFHLRFSSSFSTSSRFLSHLSIHRVPTSLTAAERVRGWPVKV